MSYQTEHLNERLDRALSERDFWRSRAEELAGEMREKVDALTAEVETMKADWRPKPRPICTRGGGTP